MSGQFPVVIYPKPCYAEEWQSSKYVSGWELLANIIFFLFHISREKLWICMEYCGGGSLQDIYHGTVNFSLLFKTFTLMIVILCF